MNHNQCSVLIEANFTKAEQTVQIEMVFYNHRVEDIKI